VLAPAVNKLTEDNHVVGVQSLGEVGETREMILVESRDPDCSGLDGERTDDHTSDPALCSFLEERPQARPDAGLGEVRAGGHLHNTVFQRQGPEREGA
jgi:hypothetical protein